jgi:hypothetical protein
MAFSRENHPVFIRGNTMTELAPPENTRRGRIAFKRIFPFIFHPRREYERMSDGGKATWLTPLLVLSILMLLRVVVTGFLRARAAAMGEVALPPDWQWWTPDMQNNYMQAMQATQGPVFNYIIPALTGLAGLWFTWAVISALLHLTSTLLGGRGSMTSALNVVGWASLPLAVRDLLRVIYMLIVRQPIASPGLSGFVTGTEGAALFLAQFLKNLDLFMIWYAILLVLGFRLVDSLPMKKAILGVLVMLIITLLAGAGLGALFSSLGGMMVTRPFL